MRNTTMANVNTIANTNNTANTNNAELVKTFVTSENWKPLWEKWNDLNATEKSVAWEMWWIRKCAIAHFAKITDYTTVEELKNEMMNAFSDIVDEMMPTIIKNKIENDEKRIEKENAKKEREEKRAAEKAEKEKIKAENAEKRKIEKAEKDAKRAAEKAEKKNVKSEKNAKHNVLTALLKTNAAKVKNTTVTTETSENA